MGSSPAQVSIDWKLLLCTVCSVPSDSGNWIMFPADKQLNHVKPLPDLKLISNFAGSLPTERSGQGVAVRMRIPPAKLEACRGHRPEGRADMAGQQQVCISAVQAGNSVFRVLVEQQIQWLLPGLPCERWFMAREEAGRDQHSQTREPAGPGSLSHGPAQRLRQAAGNSRHDHTGDSRSQTTEAAWQGVTSRTRSVARYCQWGR